MRRMASNCSPQKKQPRSPERPLARLRRSSLRAGSSDKIPNKRREKKRDLDHSEPDGCRTPCRAQLLRPDREAYE
eukprot:3820737-Heterocapsa_arctica.AAC.1